MSLWTGYLVANCRQQELNESSTFFIANINILAMLISCTDFLFWFSLIIKPKIWNAIKFYTRGFMQMIFFKYNFLLNFVKCIQIGKLLKLRIKEKKEMQFTVCIIKVTILNEGNHHFVEIISWKHSCFYCFLNNCTLTTLLCSVHGEKQLQTMKCLSAALIFQEGFSKMGLSLYTQVPYI